MYFLGTLFSKNSLRDTPRGIFFGRLDKKKKLEIVELYERLYEKVFPPLPIEYSTPERTLPPKNSPQKNLPSKEPLPEETTPEETITEEPSRKIYQLTPSQYQLSPIYTLCLDGEV